MLVSMEVCIVLNYCGCVLEISVCLHNMFEGEGEAVVRVKVRK